MDLEGQKGNRDQSFDNLAHDNSLTMDQNGAAGGGSRLEVPDRAKRFQIRQRNFDVD